MPARTSSPRRGRVLLIEDGSNLREAMAKTQAIANEVKATSENLRQTSETLESFANRINERPPDLLFGKPPQKRFNE